MLAGFLVSYQIRDPCSVLLLIGRKPRPGFVPILDSSSCHLGYSCVNVDSKACMQMANMAARTM